MSSTTRARFNYHRRIPRIRSNGFVSRKNRFVSSTTGTRTRRCGRSVTLQIHFFHIPWPAPATFRICPQAKALLDGLLGNDLLGFHCPRYSAQFMNCVDQLLEELTVDWSIDTGFIKGTARGSSTYRLA